MGRPKGSGKSPAGSGARGRQAKKGQSQQRLIEDMFQPRRSTRLRNGDEKAEKDKLQDPTELLVLEPDDAQTVTLEKRADQKGKKSTQVQEKAIASGVGKGEEKLQSQKTVAQKRDLKLTVEQQQELLKNFDLNYVYGPCRGITRRERFARAQKFNLKPLPEDIIGQILEEHEEYFSFQKCIWDQNELLKIHV